MSYHKIGNLESRRDGIVDYTAALSAIFLAKVRPSNTVTGSVSLLIILRVSRDILRMFCIVSLQQFFLAMILYTQAASAAVLAPVN
jgi:hypothetical protein